MRLENESKDFSKQVLKSRAVKHAQSEVSLTNIEMCVNSSPVALHDINNIKADFDKSYFSSMIDVFPIVFDTMMDRS